MINVFRWRTWPGFRSRTSLSTLASTTRSRRARWTDSNRYRASQTLYRLPPLCRFIYLHPSHFVILSSIVSSSDCTVPPLYGLLYCTVLYRCQPTRNSFSVAECPPFGLCPNSDESCVELILILLCYIVLSLSCVAPRNTGCMCFAYVAWCCHIRKCLSKVAALQPLCPIYC